MIHVSIFAGKAAVLLYIRKGYAAAYEKYSTESDAKAVLDYLKVVDQARKADSSTVLINLITMNELSIDFCPPNLLSHHEVRRSFANRSVNYILQRMYYKLYFFQVWLALIPRMSVECLLSNINRMSKLKLFRNRDIIQEIVRRFGQPDAESAIIHPIHVFITRKQYEEGPKYDNFSLNSFG